MSKEKKKKKKSGEKKSLKSSIYRPGVKTRDALPLQWPREAVRGLRTERRVSKCEVPEQDLHVQLLCLTQN